MGLGKDRNRRRSGMTKFEKSQANSCKSAVVFIHGQPGEAGEFREVLDRLPPEVSVVAYDRPGWGSNPMEASDLDGNAAYLRKLLAAHGVTMAILVGYSYGSAIALQSAIECPELIDGLVLIAPVGGPDSISLLDKVLVSPARFLRVFRPAKAWVRVTGARSRIIESFYTEQVHLKRDLTGLSKGVPSLGLPVELIVGMDDFFNPLNGTLELLDSLPNAHMTMLKGKGHLLLAQAPETIAEKIFSMWSEYSDR